MFGVIAASSGVFPYKSGCGRSPTPSNSTKTILISELPVIFFISCVCGSRGCFKD